MRWGLALSGGGLLGAAHLGVLKALESRGLRPDVVAGTSAGGLVAVALAAGAGAETLVAFGRDVAAHPARYFSLQVVRLVLTALPEDPLPPATGLVAADEFVAALAHAGAVPEKMDGLGMPVAVTAVDVVGLGAVAFVGGPVGDALLPGWRVLRRQAAVVAMSATMAQPGLFTAVPLGPMLLVDGGVADTLPVDWAFALGADRVVAVDVAAPGPAPTRMDVCAVVGRAEAYTTHALSRLRTPAARPVYILRPPTQGVPFARLSAYPRLVAVGRRAAEAAMEEIEGFLAQ
ncbi:MAG: patatin-like phospholipase family protein [Firmicutes bacterium]|nr:patatin-like phospholipase family protein [Bacillota bacterium]